MHPLSLDKLVSYVLKCKTKSDRERHMTSTSGLYVQKHKYVHPHTCTHTTKFLQFNIFEKLTQFKKMDRRFSQTEMIGIAKNQMKKLFIEHGKTLSCWLLSMYRIHREAEAELKTKSSTALGITGSRLL